MTTRKVKRKVTKKVLATVAPKTYVTLTHKQALKLQAALAPKTYSFLEKKLGTVLNGK